MNSGSADSKPSFRWETRMKIGNYLLSFVSFGAIIVVLVFSFESKGSQKGLWGANFLKLMLQDSLLSPLVAVLWNFSIWKLVLQSDNASDCMKSGSKMLVDSNISLCLRVYSGDKDITLPDLQVLSQNQFLSLLTCFLDTKDSPFDSANTNRRTI